VQPDSRRAKDQISDSRSSPLDARQDRAIQGQSPDRQPSPPRPCSHALHHRAPGGTQSDSVPSSSGTVASDIARITGSTAHLDETAVHPPVRAVCNMLGYDQLYLACEGRVVAVLSAEDAPRALDAWGAMPSGDEAAIRACRARSAAMGRTFISAPSESRNAIASAAGMAVDA